MRATLCFLGLIGTMLLALTGCSASTKGGTGSSTSGTTSSGTTSSGTTSTTGGTEAHTAPSSGCQPGSKKVSANILETQFCGPAKAQTTFSGQTVNWSNGECSTSASLGAFGVNIGRGYSTVDNVDVSEYQKQWDYFFVGGQVTSDGTYNDNFNITFSYKGQYYTLFPNTLTLSGGLKQGTFTGTDHKTGASVSGSFTC
jgi:hypothetical protein